MSKINSAVVALLLVQSLSVAAPQIVLAENGQTLKLTGSVERFDTAGFANQISHLTESALERDENYKLADSLVKKFSTKAHKTKVAAAELANAIVPYRGFGPSREGAQLWLEQLKKIKSLACAEYFKQRVIDETHTKTVGTVLQIAMGLDNPNQVKSEAMVKGGMDDLKKLVGEEESKRMLDVMTAWRQDIQVPDHVYEKDSWDINTLQKNVRNATAYSFHRDPIMAEVIKKLKKHVHGKAMMALATGVETTTALATLLGPGMFMPIASEAINAVFVTGTGGKEDTKMLHQMYCGKRLESRWKRVNEESQLALTSYQRALQTKSPTLLACSESVMQHLVGHDDASKIIGELVVANPNPSGPVANLDDASVKDEDKDASDKDRGSRARRSGRHKLAEGRRKDSSKPSTERVQRKSWYD